MSDLVRPYLLSFIPIFVAADPIGILPIFLSFTEGMDVSRRRKTVYFPVLTATILALSFTFLGKGEIIKTGLDK